MAGVRELLESSLKPKLKPVNEPWDPGVRSESGEVEQSDADRGGEEVADDEVNAVLSLLSDFLGWRMLAAMVFFRLVPSD